VRFKWQLEGAETQWREGLNQRLVGYGPLLPGHYRFRVLAANSDGVWNDAGAVLAFDVRPFFWETWWFKVALVGLVCGGLALAVTVALRRRHRFELERLQRRHEMERERTRIARDMHDEIGSKLARISFLSEVVKSETKGPAQADGVVDSLSRTARDLLESLDRMLWAVNPRNDSLDALSAYCNHHGAEYFLNTAIHCSLDFPKNLPAIPLSAETRHNLFLAYEEALANALKHSGANKVKAELTYRAGVLEISVADNGCGFVVDVRPEAEAKREAAGHLGLSGMCHRLQFIGGQCRVTSAPGQGTLVRHHCPEGGEAAATLGRTRQGRQRAPVAHSLAQRQSVVFVLRAISGRGVRAFRGGLTRWPVVSTGRQSEAGLGQVLRAAQGPSWRHVDHHPPAIRCLGGGFWQNGGTVSKQNPFATASNLG
jgi:signal transduction histidine kinase